MSFDNRFKRQRRILNAGFWAIALFFVMIFGFIGFVIYEIAVAAVGIDWSHGLKGVVDAIWYGKNAR